MSSRLSVVPPLTYRKYSTLSLRRRCAFVAPTRGSLGAVRGTATCSLRPTDFPTNSGSGGGSTALAAGLGSIVGRVAYDRKGDHLPAAFTEPDWERGDRESVGDFRRLFGVPLPGDGDILGILVLHRTQPVPFTQKQIELVETFADQAVIAIENPRLFEEVQARTKELQESLDRQTATSEVLGVISRSPNEVQPVLDTIVATAQRLCQAERAVIWRLEGETFRAVAHRGQPEERVESLYSARGPVSRGNMVGRATLARRAVQVEDAATDPELVAAARAFNRAGNV